MIRLVFGFVLGCIFTFYSLPFVKSVLNGVDLASQESRLPFQTKEPTYTLNPNPPTTSVQDLKYNAKMEEADELSRIMKAVSISNASPENAKAPEFVIAVISDFVKANPALGSYVRERMDGGLTNKEALEIISKQVSER